MPKIVYTVAERVEMVRQHEQGLSYRCIVDHFAATHPDRPIPSKSSVHKIVQQFHLTGNLDPSLMKVSYPNRQLTEEMKLNICLTAQERPEKPLSKIAQELCISKSSVHKVIRTHKQRPRRLKNRRKRLPQTQESPKEVPEVATPKEDKDQIMSDLSPLHYSLWSYLKNRLDSKGRAKDLSTVWNRVNMVLEGLDAQTISKINSALDTAAECGEDVMNISCKTEPVD